MYNKDLHNTRNEFTDIFFNTLKENESVRREAKLTKKLREAKLTKKLREAKKLKESEQSSLESKLNNSVTKVLTGPDFGFDLDEVKDNITVKIEEDNKDKKITVNAEFDYETMQKVLDELNKIIKAYDKDTYFEQVEPGIAEAIIHTNLKESDETTDDVPYDNTSDKTCPRCGNHYTDYPALSRKDNTTWICPDCGVAEAMEELENNF